MTYRLYWRAGSGSMVAEAALLMTGVDYALIDVPTKSEQREANFLAINPAAKIPVLITPEGQTIIESLAILMLLDDMHRQASLLPAYNTQERAIAVQWLAFLATSTYSSALRFYYSHRYTTDQSVEAIAKVKAAAAHDLDADFAIVTNAITGPFLLGETMTITDVYLAMIADWHDPAMEIPAMKVLKAAMLKNPAVKTAWENHQFTP